jgi:SAM-dependent MidA family methyltransferase
MQQWWPGSAPGERIEVGRDRDEAWRDVVSGVESGVAVAIDYGHERGSRPPFGSMRSYRSGRIADLTWDGSADVTADVALDSVAAACAGQVLRQRDALLQLGVDGTRPDLRLATTDPAGYVQALARAGEAAELTSSPGLGDFGWVVTGVGMAVPLRAA